MATFAPTSGSSIEEDDGIGTRSFFFRLVLFCIFCYLYFHNFLL